MQHYHFLMRNSKPSAEQEATPPAPAPAPAPRRQSRAYCPGLNRLALHIDRQVERGGGRRRGQRRGIREVVRTLDIHESNGLSNVPFRTLRCWRLQCPWKLEAIHPWDLPRRRRIPSGAMHCASSPAGLRRNGGKSISGALGCVCVCSCAHWIGQKDYY